jgi:hypothetical protein
MSDDIDTSRENIERILDASDNWHIDDQMRALLDERDELARELARKLAEAERREACAADHAKEWEHWCKESDRKLAEAVEVMKRYADEQCEHSVHFDGCGKLTAFDCGGCRARAFSRRRTVADMDVSKLIERLRSGMHDPLDHEAADALTAERERADKAEAEAYEAIKRFLKAEAERDDLTRKLAEAEAWWGSPGHERTRMLAALAEAVEVVKGLLKLQLIDDDDADEDLFPEWQRARAFIQKQEAGK